jgi:multimeric flavodoxin WrbA
MKALGIVGSPRENGNTTILVSEILAGAAEAGAETDLVNVAKLSIKGCQACMYCKSHDACAVQDDMQGLYQKLHEADVVVLGSPMYFGQMTGQTKAFIDRLFALMGPNFARRLAEGKQLILAFTQGAPDPTLWADHVKATGEMLGHVGLTPAGSIIVGGTGAPGDINSQPDELAKARELGKKVATS